MKIEDYHQIDQTIDSYTLRYGEIDISYMVRLHYINLLRNKQNKGNKPVKLSKLVLIRLLKGFFSTFPRLFKKNKYWVFSNAERRKQFDKYYYDRVASIVNQHNGDTLFIENPVIETHKRPTQDLILSDSVFFFFSLLFSKIYFRKNKLKVDERLYTLGEENQVKIDLNPLVKRFVGQYKAMSFYLRFFHKPKLIFSVYPGGYLGYNYAFKEYNIPVVELQHGVIYPLHFSYNTILYQKSELFKPDYIFTYGTRDKECLEALNYVKKENIFVVGSYGLQKVKDSDKENIGFYLKRIRDISKRVISVVATVNDADELYRFCLELEKKSNGSVQILLLPRQPINNFPDTDVVKVLEVHRTNVFEVYKVSDFLLTKASTAALEAMFMDIPVFVYENDLEHSLFKKNYFYLKSLNYVGSAGDFYSKISENNFISPSSEDIDSIYAKNVYSNFKEGLKQIENET